MSAGSRCSGAPRRATGGPRLELAGQTVRLDARRAALWEEARTLIVADLHLGKCEAMGALGVPLPSGLLERQLAALGAAVAEHHAARVVVVGDLLHAPAGLTDAMVACVGRWRDSVNADLVVVPGNHDRRLESVAGAWRATVTAPRWVDGPFAFEHAPPATVRGGEYLWCGHLHPAVCLRAGGDSLKLPCFHVGTRRAILPAFSTFTAGGSLPRRPGDRVFAVAGGDVIEV